VDDTLLIPHILSHCRRRRSRPFLSKSAYLTRQTITFYPSAIITMGKKDAVRPRVVCCAIPVARAAGKILLVTSRKHESWVLPKGGWEPTDGTLEAAAQREAIEEGPAFVICARCALASYDPLPFAALFHVVPCRSL